MLFLLPWRSTSFRSWFKVSLFMVHTLLHLINFLELSTFKTVLSLHPPSKCLVQIQGSNLLKWIDPQNSCQLLFLHQHPSLRSSHLHSFLHPPYKSANTEQPECVLKIRLHRLSWKSNKNGIELREDIATCLDTVSCLFLNPKVALPGDGRHNGTSPEGEPSTWRICAGSFKCVQHSRHYVYEDGSDSACFWVGLGWMYLASVNKSNVALSPTSTPCLLSLPFLKADVEFVVDKESFFIWLMSGF